MENKSGIYKITNILNGKVYIGLTRDLKTRKYNHFYYLNKGKHHNEHLQNSFNKYYGKLTFKFTVIEYCKPEELSEQEKYYITFYQSNNPKCGYNLTVGGEDTFITDKAFISNKSRLHPSKPVIQYNIKGKKIKEYDSITAAANNNNLCKMAISSCCLVNEKFDYMHKTHNIIFIYKEHEDKIEYLMSKGFHKKGYLLVINKKGKIIDKFRNLATAKKYRYPHKEYYFIWQSQLKEFYKSFNSKKIIVFKKTGELIEVIYSSKAAKQKYNIKILFFAINKKGDKLKPCKGHYFIYINQFQKFYELYKIKWKKDIKKRIF